MNKIVDDDIKMTYFLSFLSDKAYKLLKIVCDPTERTKVFRTGDKPDYLQGEKKAQQGDDQVRNIE